MDRVTNLSVCGQHTCLGAAISSARLAGIDVIFSLLSTLL